MMCHRIGLPPTSTKGLGLEEDSSAIRVPRPPANMTARIFLYPGDRSLFFLAMKQADTCSVLSLDNTWTSVTIRPTVERTELMDECVANQQFEKLLY